MSPFITFREQDEKGELQYYILQREFPHFIGIISYMPVDGVKISAPVSGHNLYIVIKGTLRGGLIPSYPTIFDEMKAVVSSMALWFYDNRILPDEKRYKKFKISTDVSASSK